MANRLAGETSPYLLQHSDNPVDWYPWGEEATARARELDRPLLVSVGYSACHWCHVMAHESFEDPETAALMNERFVCVKVDREERPDVDALCMEACQAITGRRFDEIPQVIQNVISATPAGKLESIRQVLELDAEARRTAGEQVEYLSRSNPPISRATSILSQRE